MLDDHLRQTARPLRDLLELIAASVYFAPEAHARYDSLGLTYSPAYFASRGGSLGQVRGEVVAAAFGVFKPSVVKAAIDEAWAKVDVVTILDARLEGQRAFLGRAFAGSGITDGHVGAALDALARLVPFASYEGRALCSGLHGLGYPGDPVGDLWRAADILREHRGDSHIIAWTSHGLGPVDATLLTELWWRIPLGSYVKTRGYDDDDVAAAIEGLRGRGLIDGDAFTPAGEALRAEVEVCTDLMERPIVEAIDDPEALFATLTPLAEAVLAAKGYPVDPRSMTRP